MMSETRKTNAIMSDHLKSLLEYLKSDPSNEVLRLDSARSALEEERPDVVQDILSIELADTDIAAQAQHLLALACMKARDFEQALNIFHNLLVSTASTDPGLLFNAAWSAAMVGEKQRALSYLSDETVLQLGQAAMLKVQLLHESGEFERAELIARELLQEHAEHSGFLAAVSVLAIDIEDERLAKDCASRAGAHPDALSTLGTLQLGGDDPRSARTFFEQSLSINPHAPRSWLGRGLCDLIDGHYNEALANIDRCADLFGSHIGSWIAAGWAALMKKDYVGSRRRFARALELDRNFAESHGGLAVIDILEAKPEEGRQKLKTALKLDRHCFSAALARFLILSEAQDTKAAAALLERAMHTPIQGSDRTIAQTMAVLGFRSQG